MLSRYPRRHIAAASLACALASSALLPGSVSGQPADWRAACEGAQLVITLQWDDRGRDWELHLIRPGGRINDDASDCTWTSCISEAPDWGQAGVSVDNPRKDTDDTGAGGTERICLPQPTPGLYTILVEHWSSGGSPAADGFVTIEAGGETYVTEVADLAPHHVWTAATVEWPPGQVEIFTDTTDCSAAWSGGCQLPLPSVTAGDAPQPGGTGPE